MAAIGNVLAPPGEHVPTADQRILLYQMTWEGYEAILELRGDRSAPRMAYIDGVIEIMSPSYDHDRIKSYIGRLVEAYVMARGDDIIPIGSWTLKEAPKAGVDPDECYIFGAAPKGRPDLVIEVVWTSGGIDKLEIYRELGIAEAWFWIRGAIQVFVLVDGVYERRERSAALPGLDLAMVCELFEQPSLTQAIRELHRRLATK